ncbi:hypothetical protein HYFRA_00005261 [Hymenoscyphus fraxineus]|uniref:DUF7872 domain-containing protein n=1 Tax=Hymenoscyphus fraxineus TaxID=746836 RepID=A0A9N9LCW9_9HELO|nr:hypothetical protein HYFRA_00005261 [Hymenoscyphus fraxineus]
MYSHTILLAAYGLWAIAAFPLALPSPQGLGTGADSCPSEALNNDTWIELDLDNFLLEAAHNITPAETNNVQALAEYFGAPNFFCGLDNFCNAGQPCLPVTTPAWYVMVAIQNWNQYMNSLHTAVMFATSIMSLIIPQVVNDFNPPRKGRDTPMKNMIGLFTLVLGYIPWSGQMTKFGDFVGNARFSLAHGASRIKPTVQPDQFMIWSDVAASLGGLAQDYQRAIGVELKRLLDSPIDAKDGLGSILGGGDFLGIAQNFSQADLQERVTDVITRRAIALVLQAQKAFIWRFPNGCQNEEDFADVLCMDGGDDEGGMAGYKLIKPDFKRHGNANAMHKEAELLIKKYGMTKDEIFLGPIRCYENNGRQQLANPFGDILPQDKSADCLFNLQICSKEDPSWKGEGIIKNCLRQGLDLA